MAPPIPDMTITNVDPLIVPTTGNVWVHIQGTNFFVANSVDPKSYNFFVQYEDGKEAYEPASPLEAYVQSDTDIWAMAPPVSSFIGLGGDDPPLTETFTRNIGFELASSLTGKECQSAAPFLRYDYLPSVVSIDVGSPVLWTGQFVDGCTVTLDVPAPAGQTLTATLTSSVPGVTFNTNPVTFGAGATTGQFQTIVAADATPGPFSITASLSLAGPGSTIPGAAGTPVVTAEISAGQIFVDLQGTYLTNPASGEDTGILEGGTPVFCTFYVRTEVPSQFGTISTNFPVFPPLPQHWSPGQLVQFTLPSPAKNISFTIGATYGAISAPNLGTFAVADPIKIPPIHGGPNPI